MFIRIESKTLHKTVLSFIGRIRQEKPDLAHEALNGKCLEFAMFLHYHFPSSEIYWDENHAIVKISDKFYDINGWVNKGNHEPLDNYSLAGQLRIFKL